MSCEYCVPKENGETEELFKRDQQKGRKLWVYLADDGLNIESDCLHCNSNVVIHVDYCPKCGEKLVEE